MAYIGFDTSNYTTSVAVYFPQENRVVQRKKLLPVKSGEKGLRQSDAVFHHTRSLSGLVKELFEETGSIKLEAVGASVSPRMSQNSYMPCFLVGENTASCLSSASNIPFYKTSHQHGHILAALYSADKLELIREKFIAFHVSGGTTEALLVEPDNQTVFKCSVIASSLDLKAGQAIDRAGVMLGLDFPCGAQLDILSRKSKRSFNIKPSIIDGFNCSLSGVENKCKKMLDEEYSKEDIALFVISYISETLEKMTDALLSKYGNLPLVYAGGVMSNSIIREKFSSKYGAYFAQSRFSSDNAAGIAIMAYLQNEKIKQKGKI